MEIQSAVLALHRIARPFWSGLPDSIYCITGGQIAVVKMKQRVTVLGLAILLVTLLVSCIESETSGIRPDAVGIEGTDWHLVEGGGIPISLLSGEQRPFVKFDAVKKEATGFAGCNNYFGNYELDGSLLKFGPIGATRMFCEGELGEVELRFMQALEQTRTWELRDGMLLLLDGSKVLARFTTVHDEQGP
jgi:heat shock protein HslJ